MGRWRTAGSLLLAVPVAVAFQSGAVPLMFYEQRGRHVCSQTRSTPLPDPMSSSQCIDGRITHTRLCASRKKGNAYSASNHKERSWLRWMDARLQETPTGELKPGVMKNFQPIMNIYAKRRSPEGADMADKLMRRIIEEVEAGNEHAKLKTNTCNTVLSAWAKSGRRDASEEATKLLISMSRMSREQIHDVKPNTISFTTVIDSWARSNSKNAALKAEAILELMQKEGSAARPNTISFNSVINAWARSDAVDKTDHAEKLWSRMEDLYKAGNGDVRPDVWTYQSLISAWSSSKVPGAPQRCEELLQLMDKKYKEGDESVKPNALCFTAAINAWSKSQEENNAQNAHRILQYMNKLYKEGNVDVRPNVVAYTAALNACANPPEDETEMREYFDTALLVMDELRLSDYDVPNYITYATMLKVCSKCLPKGEELDSIARRTFDKCCRDGQVGDVVLTKLRRRYPTLSRELLVDQLSEHGGNLSSEQLPLEWRCNVKGERKAKRRRHGQKSGNGGAKMSRDSMSKLNKVKTRKGSGVFGSKGRTADKTSKPKETQNQTGSWRDRAKSLDDSSLLS